jgi:Rrf2 family protein
VQTALNISEAAGLAIHAVTIIARTDSDAPVKLDLIATELGASAAHLGKVLHRLATEGIVASKRGPSGGFVLGPKAKRTTLLHLYEMFDGPLSHGHCLLGHKTCPQGGCVLGNAVKVANEQVRKTLGRKRVIDLKAESGTRTRELKKRA